MTSGASAALAAATFGAALLSSITGGTSLLTVPLLMIAGLDAQEAIATNMVLVAILSGGASAPYVVARKIRPSLVLPLAATAVPGSLAGAMLTVALDEKVLRALISVALLGIATLSLAQPRLGAERRPVSRRSVNAGYVVLAVWALYGGLFSGGYATVLTLGIVTFFGEPLGDAIGEAKVVNFVGSLAASLVFVTRGQVHWQLIPWMGAGAALGGSCGAWLALRARPQQLRRLFALVLAGIGAKVGYASLGTGRTSQP